VAVGGPYDAMCSGIGMAITLPGHPMSVIQHYFNHEYWLLNVMFMFRPPLLMIVYVQIFWSVVLCNDVSSVFYFKIEGSHPSEGAG